MADIELSENATAHLCGCNLGMVTERDRIRAEVKRMIAEAVGKSGTNDNFRAGQRFSLQAVLDLLGGKE